MLQDTENRKAPSEDSGEKDATVLHNPHVDVSEVDEAKLVRKMDWRLIPWLSFLYLLSFLDRTSIGNARLYRMTADLHLSDKEYLLCLTIFYFPYALFEVPSNVLLKRVRPSIWLSILMILWGITMTSQGLARNYRQLLGLRFLLGVFEAGLFPGVNYYLSCWYKRSEFGIRAALFFSAATVSGAFGGLLAATISNMEGVGGKPGWAWIFILEGLATVVAGLLSFWIVQDFPDNAKFLTEAERTIVIRRLQSDDQHSAAGEELKMKYIRQSLSDWKTYSMAIMFAGCVCPLYAFALFLPTIINQIGYSATPANLLTVPVYVLACATTCAAGFYGDRKGRRGLLIAMSFCVAGAGYIILITSKIPGLSYFAVYLAACGIFSIVPNSIAWVTNNVEGSYKRSVSLAISLGFSNLNGTVASNVYRARDRPWFTLGHGIALTYIGIGILTCSVHYFALKAENSRRDRGLRDEIIDGVNDKGDPETVARLARLNGRFASVEDAKREKGDSWSGYRYVL